MKLKTSELFCASPASTAICTTMNHHAMVRRGGPGNASTPKPLNHHHRHHNYYNNHYQFDFGDKPKFKAPAIPCTSQQHLDPKPFASYLQKSRKSTSAAYSTRKNNDHLLARRKSSVELNDRNTSGGSSSRYLLHDRVKDNDYKFQVLRPLKPTELHGDKDNDYVCNTGVLVVSEQIWPDDHNDSPALVKSRSSSVRLHGGVDVPGSKPLRSRSHNNQVVELRVSIHCKGCEGKVRKHISRMEGVKSFQIDLESKKVTVVGDITPLSVLSSISKVKNAQLWPSPTSASPSPSPFIAIGY